MPPVGADWCLKGPGNQESQMMVYNVSDIAKPSVEEHAHSYYLYARRVRRRRRRTLKNADDLLKWTKIWIDGGAGLGQRVTGKPSPAREARPVHRFIHGDAERDDTLGIECVRYRVTSDERDNQLYPGSVLELVTEGYYCLNLTFPNEVISVGSSERYIKDSGEAPPSSIR